MTKASSTKAAQGTIKTYYRLTKPGIVYGNGLAAIAGFFLASAGHIQWGLFVATIIGLSLIIAGACVCNNFIDRDIDKKMQRTKDRALVVGQVDTTKALAFACLLVLAGSFLLGYFVNKLTMAIALFGFLAYVVVYGYAKRRTVYGTIVGSISGAIPPVVGYCAVSNGLDLGAFLLFLILVIWQMPHFYAISIFRLNDYKAASIPVWPAEKGIQSTKQQILLFIFLYILAACSLTAFGYTGYIYLVVMLAFGLYWLKMAISGYASVDDTIWARKVFGFSLIVLLVFCAMVSVSSWLP